MIEGELELTIDGKSEIAKAGIVAIVPANIRHSVRALTEGRLIVVDDPHALFRVRENPLNTQSRFIRTPHQSHLTTFIVASAGSFTSRFGVVDFEWFFSNLLEIIVSASNSNPDSLRSHGIPDEQATELCRVHHERMPEGAKGDDDEYAGYDAHGFSVL